MERQNIYNYTNISIDDVINTDGINNVFDSYFEPEYPDYEYHGPSSSKSSFSEIEAIFER